MDAGQPKFIRKEVLDVATEVARERGIDRERVLGAMEQALKAVAHLKYGEAPLLDVVIDRRSGEIRVLRKHVVVEAVVDPAKEITLEQARVLNPHVQMDGAVEEVLPPVDFKRVGAQVMRHVVFGLLREATREREYALYKDKAGTIVSGSVKMMDHGSVVLDLGQAEGILRREDLIPRERFRPGDRVRAYVREVRQDPRSFQIILSRTHPQFVDALFRQEVPEVYDGTIELKSIARDPGSRAKIGVWSKDPSLDPVGSCVGIRGSRVQAVTKELCGERIDVIAWSEDLLTFLVNALTPAEVTKVVMGDDDRSVTVVVPDDQHSIAIGRRGQNVRLASVLTELHIDITTESEEAERREAFMVKASAELQEALTIDDVIARLLITEGFESVEDVVRVSEEELGSIAGFSEELAGELKKRAEDYLIKRQKEKQEAFLQAGGDQALLTFDEGLDAAHLAVLVQHGIKTVDDLAELSSDELCELVDGKLEGVYAERLILKARGVEVSEETQVDADAHDCDGADASVLEDESQGER